VNLTMHINMMLGGILPLSSCSVGKDGTSKTQNSRIMGTISHVFVYQLNCAFISGEKDGELSF